VEWMGEWNRGVDVARSVPLEGQTAQERRDAAHRVDSRAAIVDEAGEGQLGGSTAATGYRFGFQDGDRSTGARERDRRRQSVWSGADDDDVVARSVNKVVAARRRRAPCR